MDRTDKLRRIVIVWSLVSGVVHVSWELGWCLVSRHLASPDALHGWRRIWSLYGVADRRYLHADSFIEILEWVTCTVGGFLNFYVVHQALRRQLRRATVALLVVSLMEAYGTLLYLGSEIFTGFANVNTASFVDAWLKFLGVNLLWVVFPGLFVYESLRWLVNGGRCPLLAPADSPPPAAAPVDEDEELAA